jgi:hypothetical protein
MTVRAYYLSVFFTLICIYPGVAAAQDLPSDSGAVALTLQAGVPLNVELVKPLPIKHAGVPVVGRVVEPVFVFDQMVIPPGTQVLGSVTHVEGISRKQRARAIANGDFTPFRKAHIGFDTLVLKDGKRLPVQTVVSQGAPHMVHLTAGEKANKKKGRVRGAVEQARQEAKAREQETVKEITAPGKMQRLRSRLLAELPYHRQVLPAGTHFTAELKTPLEFGKEHPSQAQLANLGDEIPPGSTVHVRLLTALSSASDHKGTPIRALVSEPVFSSAHQLILPEGARLEGSVTQAVPARRLGRNGQLRFTFHQIELPSGAPRRVEASLQGVDAPSGSHVELDTEGGAHALTPKTRYVVPAIDVFLASSSLDGLDPHHHRTIDPGERGAEDAGNGAVRGGAGFGLVGTAIGLLAHYRPLSAGFAFYGAGWSVYSHIMARGADVVFPKNTPMEIRFGTHESSTPPPDGKKSLPHLPGKPSKAS